MSLAMRVCRLEQENLELIKTIEHLEDRLNGCCCEESEENESEIEELDFKKVSFSPITTEAECSSDSDEEESDDEFYTGEYIEGAKELIGQLSVGEITANQFVKGIKEL